MRKKKKKKEESTCNHDTQKINYLIKRTGLLTDYNSHIESFEKRIAELYICCIPVVYSLFPDQG